MAIRAPAQHLFPLLHVTVAPKGTASAGAEKKKSRGLEPHGPLSIIFFLEIFLIS